MILPVEHIDTAGSIHNKSFYLSRLAFAKHMAFAGQGQKITPGKLMRTLGMFLHYRNYLHLDAFRNNHFSLPPGIFSNPTEKSQFSNIAGVAIADFLSKKIDNSLYTLNYEAVATRPIKKDRPDLIAFSNTSVFTLEAKGRSQSNPGDMVEHKTQAKAGTYRRNFSVACVSYNIYNNIKCNYHDPYNDNVSFDIENFRRVTRQYYSALAQFVNSSYFEISEFSFQEEVFYEIGLTNRSILRLFSFERISPPFWPFEVIDWRFQTN